MRALVTGGAGFVGAALVERLLAEGHDVDVVDDLSSGSLANLAEARAVAGGRLSFHHLDIRGPDVVALAARRGPEVVFHLAAATASPPEPIRQTEIAVLGSLRVLEAARRCGAAKVVFASRATADIYGPLGDADLPAREGAAQRPLSHRGVAERAVDGYLRMYRERYSLEFSTLIVGSVYGPGRHPRHPGGVVGTFARRLVSGEACVIDGDGNQRRDFVFVDDVVDAVARAAGRGGGLSINVATGVGTTVNDLYGAMAAAAGVTDPAEHRGPRPLEVAPGALDPARAGIQLGWAPWTSLLAGIDATLEWWRGQDRS